MKVSEKYQKHLRVFSLLFATISLVFRIFAHIGLNSVIGIAWFDYLFGWVSLLSAIIALVIILIVRKYDKKNILIRITTIIITLVILSIIVFVLFFFIALSLSPY